LIFDSAILGKALRTMKLPGVLPLLLFFILCMKEEEPFL